MTTPWQAPHLDATSLEGLAAALIGLVLLATPPPLPSPHVVNIMLPQPAFSPNITSL